ncbi:MAG: hypothetical protein GX384_08830 [Clostridiaceae bacterium]|jgi:hypothetical protein|nr:hypothetical protein [Clostridiaceae bacterium]
MNKFDRFLRHRQSLLLQYKMGDLTKNEFIEENFHYIERLGIQPFTRVDNIKKAIYNYHYHNVNAKYWQRIARDTRNTSKERQAYYTQSYNHYREKDRSTLQLLRLIDYSGVEAYYVNVRSSLLKGKLIEIVIHNPDVLMEINTPGNTFEQELLILHTKSQGIAEALRNNGVLREDKRKSLTDSYINQKY